MNEEKMTEEAPRQKDDNSRPWFQFWKSTGEFRGNKINDIPVPEDFYTKSAAEIMANPPSFPKLKR